MITSLVGLRRSLVRYTHPHKHPVGLADVFVYPDLKEIHYERDGVDQPIIRSRDVVTYVLNDGRVIIIAEEKAGKTSLAKSLIRDLHHNGKVAIAPRWRIPTQRTRW